jgi:two-component system response regulator NreC
VTPIPLGMNYGSPRVATHDVLLVCDPYAREVNVAAPAAVETTERARVEAMTDLMEESSEAITVVLADDHAVVRSALHMLLDAEPDFAVVAEAGDAASALRYVRGHKPRVLILDLNMPGKRSLDTIPEIREASPETRIVVLTMQDEPAFAREAMQAGVLGYVLKEAAHSELVKAVRMAADGETYLQPELGARLAAELPQSPDGLSERETDVLRLIALGHTNAEIAGKLYLSVRTVESHRAHIQQKLQRTTRSELVRYALDRGLLNSSDAAD